MDGFEAQVGEVCVFPSRMQLIDDGDITQLRWRYYESSGDVTYSAVNTDNDTDVGVLGFSSGADGFQCQKCLNLEQHIQQLGCRMDEMERFIRSQGTMWPRFAAISNTDHICQQLFSLLRNKVAGVVQKPLLSYRHRDDSDGTNSVFDWSCAGTLRAEVDCTVAQFEMACCQVKHLYNTSFFTVDGHQFTPHSGCLRASTGVAEILFSSLSELCKAVGICHDTDVMNIARKERRAGKAKRMEDAGVRIAGTFLLDREIVVTPAAILVCRSLHEGLFCRDKVEVLTREDQELNPRSVWYRHPLRRQNMDISSLLKYVHPDVNNSPRSYKDLLSSTRSLTSCFGLRWRSLPNPSSKTWSRTMLMRPDFAGVLEMDIPCILFRGAVELTRGTTSCQTNTWAIS